ncbi:F-box/kelch-repeat protein At3g23880-like [Humulus lupulus]|uniref:F-box/kelch-repeat protein At3g23880-like n=1 Tax=Humulus lupulus TaxID=3486 RepID=UPI002B40AB5D|nr:F-box/kelch-repeat protein At3g23880-like [Humulus lupulus]XP_062082982.1 F-box/kelch-repeat protein At3g23880-like [Humulus lupulus]
MAMATKWCDMPEWMLEEIFSWLPPEHLMRFKCVSKSWYSLIILLVKNPIFVKKHLGNIYSNNKMSSTRNLVFCCYRPGYCPDPDLEFWSPYELYSLLTMNDNDRLSYVSEDFDMPIPRTELDMSCVLGCHCNGIICLCGSHKAILLCNLAMKEFRTLPKPYPPLGDFVFVVVGIGFYYDSRVNDYKVIRFGCERLFPGSVVNPKPRADIYSMATDSWRRVETQLEFDGLPYPGEQVFCKGVFYWSMWTGAYFIISFDVFDEGLCRIPLPDSLFETQIEQLKLALWNESVVLFFYPGERGSPISIQVWELDDCHGGVKGSCSWIKKLIIGPLVDVVTPWTFWKSDELLLEATGGGLVSYNLSSQMLRNLTIPEAGRIVRWEFSYVKSLVSVHGEEQAG